ncbi:ragulator complex protein lamtor2 [Anaeramoeba ignava]|uniref:Ragulator complex protein lamtor2 n=1 Tax=Anaeramoeba ignava TaxID=1746090 RepID=A0A9Q0R5D9_ANAIG|nr:ragulator complex protein lamtor2 [Anaeramoeba ignava]
MLKPKLLTKTLQQTNTDGINGTMLFNSDGSLIASSGDRDKNRTIAAITANIWQTYQKKSNDPLINSDLNVVMINCKEGKVIIKEVCKMFLCVHSGNDVPTGILKEKLISLAKFLEPSLSKIVI